MSEGRQTETGQQDAHPREKVVRLPRDWLGPRDELVPFGPRARSLEAEQTTTVPDDPPPSAEDFWGERSAAIHSALQPLPDDARDGSVGARTIRSGRVDRRTVAGVAAGFAIAAVVVIALVLSSLGPGATPRPAGGSKAGFAAVFSPGVSSVLRLDLARIGVARPLPSKILRASHRRSAPRLAHKTVRPRAATAVRLPRRVVAAATPTTAGSTSYHQASTDVTDVGNSNTHVDTQPATTSAPPPPASQPVSSRAAVSPTGQSGALGPVQSPNG